MTAFHLDAGFKALFAFGHGLSYASFHYQNLTTHTPEIHLGDMLHVGVDVTNQGDVVADEVVQLYVRDLVGSVTRPVKITGSIGNLSGRKWVLKKWMVKMKPEASRASSL